MSVQAAEARPAAPAAGVTVHRWTPTSLFFTASLAAIVVVLFFVPLTMSDNVMQKLTSLFILVILAVMWNALAGYGGLVSVGQQAFIGIGAYATIFLAHVHGMAVWPAMLLAALIAGAVSIPVAAVALQLRGGAFAIGTWVVAEIFAILVGLDKSLGAGTGTSLIELNYLDPHVRQQYIYWAALGTAAVLLVALFLLLRSRLGAALQAIRDDQEAAASVGVHVLAGKAVLFVLAGLGCGAAGVLTLDNQLFIEPNSIFSVDFSALMIFMVLVGGLGTFDGPIVGAIVLFIIQQTVGDNGVWYFMLLGAVAIAFALFLPRGLMGTLQDRLGLRLMPVGYRLRTRAGLEPDADR